MNWMIRLSWQAFRITLNNRVCTDWTEMRPIKHTVLKSNMNIFSPIPLGFFRVQNNLMKKCILKTLLKIEKKIYINASPRDHSNLSHMDGN